MNSKTVDWRIASKVLWKHTVIAHQTTARLIAVIALSAWLVTKLAGIQFNTTWLLAHKWPFIVGIFLTHIGPIGVYAATKVLKADYGDFAVNVTEKEQQD